MGAKEKPGVVEQSCPARPPKGQGNRRQQEREASEQRAQARSTYEYVRVRACSMHHRPAGRQAGRHRRTALCALWRRQERHQKLSAAQRFDRFVLTGLSMAWGSPVLVCCSLDRQPPQPAACTTTHSSHSNTQVTA